jgi:hypothetical protein
MSKRYVWDKELETWVEAERPQGLDRVIVAGVGGKAGWPLYSDGAGVLPSQIPEAQEQLRKAGLRDDCFTPAGRMKFHDAAHRRQVLKAIGMVDRSSFS